MHKISKITLLSAIVLCIVCLFVKSFFAIHTYPEYKGVGVNLMLKVNPWDANFVCEDRQDADMESPLHICWDEMMFIGQNTIEGIFYFPLSAYISFLVLLAAIYLKLRNPKLRKSQLIIAGTAIIIFSWVVWMFSTYEPSERLFSEQNRYLEPSEKFYSIDNQYSAYFKLYNINKIKPISIFYTFDFGFAGVRSPQYYYKRKIYLYDEIEKKVLKSRYFGDGNEIDNAKWGFIYWEKEQEFALQTGVYYKLPRPIDERILQEHIRQERAVMDSINKKHNEKIELFLQHTVISQEDIDYIQPVIKRWTDYYDIELLQARLISIDSTYFNRSPDISHIHYRDFTQEYDSPSRIEMSYSPDKQRYVDIGVVPELIDGKYYDKAFYNGFQEVCLIDRKQKQINTLFDSEGKLKVHDALWKDNDVFITVGFEYSELYKYQICIFDITKQTIKRYEILDKDYTYDNFSSYRYIYIKERGINKK